MQILHQVEQALKWHHKRWSEVQQIKLSELKETK